jgi:hypothetical protein
MKNISHMPVKIDIVRFPANYASACAVGIIYMAWSLIKVTFAGVSFCICFWDVIHLSILDKSTLAAPYVLPRASAR